MSKPPLTSEAVDRAFHRLAEEHFAPDPKRDEATWQKIQQRSGLRPASLRSVVNARRYGRGIIAATSVAIAAAAAGLLFGGASSPQPHRFSYRVETALTPSDASASREASVLRDSPGELIASEDNELRLTFTDESRAILAPHTTLRLATSGGPPRVDGRLAQGRLTFRRDAVRAADAQPPAAEILLRAGTVQLKALGASFVFAYFPGDDRVELTTLAGVVRLTDRKGESHQVKAGEHLVLSEKVEAAAQPESSSALGALPVQQKAREKSAASAAAPETQPGLSFAQLAADGKFAEVVAVAKAQGMSQVLATASASDLQELAQAAKYTGDTALAARVWTRLTTRFAGTSTANSAHFFLGRLAEQQGDHTRALTHYERYLQVPGAGLYAAEALGRKLNIVQTSQGNQKALPIAREYLRQFPRGAYAKVANELVEAD